jgi:hypothetical protein
MNGLLAGYMFRRAARAKDGLCWEGCTMTTLLFIIAAILVIAGIVTIVRGSVLFGIVLIVVGLLVGPGGVSIFG